ncbi:hypothetical protein DOTSEDRAFT_86319 [Dothistroma septosporum NZE10]|uniref:Uncharacterized protein n=1 Tax=Dothistroma septosporum (strain NZE10 / CBS 128990) TaxID=675120 RepID=N1PY91_DOTSN|nr:hypothetical protein DOTSEDRAFT_86319 [Dothistroma septosporum NZE10]
MSSPPRTVVLDCVGTLFSYSALFTAIDTRLGDKLRVEGVKPILFGYIRIEVAEREYIYLSMSGKYHSFATILQALFWRDADFDCTMKGYRALELRKGAKECFEKLRSAGFRVIGFTMGDVERIGEYFMNAGVDMSEGDLLSCDSSRIGKPDPEAYRPLLEELSREGGEPWFAAAHMWDVSAAKRKGFKGAYCSSDTLPEMADKIIATSK